MEYKDLLSIYATIPDKLKGELICLSILHGIESTFQHYSEQNENSFTDDIRKMLFEKVCNVWDTTECIDVDAPYLAAKLSEAILDRQITPEQVADAYADHLEEIARDKRNVTDIPKTWHFDKRFYINPKTEYWYRTHPGKKKKLLKKT